MHGLGPIRPGFPSVRPDLGALAGYHSAQAEVLARLNTNESPLPPPPKWFDAFREGLAEIEFNRYPDRHAAELRRAVARLHDVRPEQVFCANGSNEILQLLMLAYGGPGRTAALFEPTYSLHRQISRVCGTDVVSGRRDEGFRLDLDEVKRVVGAYDPVVTFLCSPNNPTGMADTPEQISSVLSIASGLVIVDEAYGQFAPSSALDLMRAGGPGTDRLVVVRTFSKTWSLAGLRLGYVVADPDVISSCELVSLPYHLDAAKQLAGRLALDFGAEMEMTVAMLREERGRIAAALAELPVQTWRSDANFILFRPTSMDAYELWSRLLDSSVLVRDCSRWPGVSGCLRVTVGLPLENNRFLAALTKILQ